MAFSNCKIRGLWRFLSKEIASTNLYFKRLTSPAWLRIKWWGARQKLGVRGLLHSSRWNMVDQDASSGAGEKWSHFAYVLKVETIGFRMDQMVGERKRERKASRITFKFFSWVTRRMMMQLTETGERMVW